MKYLVRFNKEDNSFIDMQSVSDEYIHKYHDVEELEQKQGFYVSYEYDKVQDKIIGKYVEIPKSSEELMREEIEKLKRAIIENKKDLDLGGLDTLGVSSPQELDLSELDNI